jgi:hypothetical protein
MACQNLTDAGATPFFGVSHKDSPRRNLKLGFVEGYFERWDELFNVSSNFVAA